MHESRLDLADLLTAGGTAMGASNRRLREAGAPALLREFRLEVQFLAALQMPQGECGIRFRRVAVPGVQRAPLLRGVAPNVRLEATFIAAPSLVPGPAGGAGP